MKITFVGLSCFLLESSKGDRLLLEPYYGDAKYGLGLKFPEEIQADVFLVSHPDEDHSYMRHSMIRQRQDANKQDAQTDTDLFPEFDLRGTIVREYNGDACIAYSFTIDGIRFLHLADNAHILSERQIKEIGSIDIVFLPMPKGDHNVVADIISQLNPKVVIPSHYIPVLKNIQEPTHDQIAGEIRELFTAEWMKDANNNEFTQNVFVNLFENARALHDSGFNYEEINSVSSEFSKELLPHSTHVQVFRDCLGMQVT